MGLILYRSKYGATKKYADWLGEKTGFTVLPAKEATKTEIANGEPLILCGAIYASGISGLSVLRKNQALLAGKKVAIFCVGASPYDEKALEDVKKNNLRDDLGGIPLFYGRGAWDEGAMTAVDRTLCKMLQKSLAKKDPSEYEPWMRALMSAAGKSCDWTDPVYLQPLLTWLGPA